MRSLTNLYKLFAGNQTTKQALDNFFCLYNIGPNKGIALCDTKAIPSGPHYLILFDCKRYIKNKNGHMKLISISQ